ncbi:MAG: ectoine synthase [Proteobacteria bacterium]|nr:ectoine synthase [Pseudomonadota bacterium]
MIVRRLTDILGGPREVRAENWTSRRLLLRDDGMGYSVHDTIIHPGTSTRMEYRNHLEAVYCIEGHGSVTALATGEQHKITPGTIYALDQHDEHILYAETQLRLVCVFNPPLNGSEVHDERGLSAGGIDHGEGRTTSEPGAS